MTECQWFLTYGTIGSTMLQGLGIGARAGWISECQHASDSTGSDCFSSSIYGDSSPCSTITGPNSTRSF